MLRAAGGALGRCACAVRTACEPSLVNSADVYLGITAALLYKLIWCGAAVFRQEGLRGLRQGPRPGARRGGAASSEWRRARRAPPSRCTALTSWHVLPTCHEQPGASRCLPCAPPPPWKVRPRLICPPAPHTVSAPSAAGRAPRRPASQGRRGARADRQRQRTTGTTVPGGAARCALGDAVTGPPPHASVEHSRCLAGSRPEQREMFPR